MIAPTILLTRSHEENERIAPEIHRYGFRTLSVPMIEFHPLAVDPLGFRTTNKLTGEEPILLTSSRATGAWLELRSGAFADLHPSGYILVGARSAVMLGDADPDTSILVVAESVADLLSSDHAAEIFRGVETIVYPCSSLRREELVEGLRARRIRLCELPLYRPVVPADASAALRRVIEPLLGEGSDPLAFLFFSPSAVDNFFELLSFPLQSIPPRRAIFCAIGTTTADALRRKGITEVIIPPHPNLAALLEVLALRL
jgi:uroporphyrinogen III methyltransferase/synthase